MIIVKLKNEVVLAGGIKLFPGTECEIDDQQSKVVENGRDMIDLVFRGVFCFRVFEEDFEQITEAD